MILSRIVVGPIGTNCYIVKDEVTGIGFVVDPGADEGKILSEIDRLGAAIQYVILTHGHFDHSFAAKAVCDATGAKLVMHKDDARLLADGAGIVRHVYASKIKEIMDKVYKCADIYVGDNDTLEAGSLTLKFSHVPGHTAGGLLILCDDAVFTGDTLMKGTIGRTDFDESLSFEMDDSIKNKVLPLSDTLRVYPGHGALSTMENEKRTNPFLKNI